MKNFKKGQIAAIKNTAKSVMVFVDAKEKAQEKIAEQQKIIDDADKSIETWEGPIKMLTGGYTTQDLIERQYVEQMNEDGTPKLNKDGSVSKKSVLVFKYPETIIPATVDEQPAEATEEENEQPLAMPTQSPAE